MNTSHSSCYNHIAYFRSEMELQNLYRAEIFDRTQNIKKLVSDMSLHALVQEQLMDVEDSNIINSLCCLQKQYLVFRTFQSAKHYIF